MRKLVMASGASVIPSAGRRGPLPTPATVRASLMRRMQLSEAEADAFLSGGYAAYFVLKMRQRRAAREAEHGD